LSANLDLVRSIYADWERGDFGRIDWADPGIEIVAPDGPDPEARTGYEAIAAGWRDFLGAWGDYRVQADDYRELDGGGILVLMQHGGYGKASGLGSQKLTTGGATLFHVRGGKVAKLVLYWNRDHALADLGLEE
jgi:hypothetical protein